MITFAAAAMDKQQQEQRQEQESIAGKNRVFDIYEEFDISWLTQQMWDTLHQHPLELYGPV
jgi:hypothetical protein